MTKHETRIIHQEDLPLGGFAGIVERRIVMNPSFWDAAKGRKDISHGLSDFIYLASGHFKENDGAPMHPHDNVDIVSFIPNGAVGHEGTMGHGTSITGPGVQVQRAGTGIEHAEFNLKNEKTDLVQMWFMPPQKGLKPGYKDYTLNKNGMTSVLGGEAENFNSKMHCQIGFLKAAQDIKATGSFVAFLQKGKATANGTSVKSGDLVEGTNLSFTATEECTLVLIQEN